MIYTVGEYLRNTADESFKPSPCYRKWLRPYGEISIINGPNVCRCIAINCPIEIQVNPINPSLPPSHPANMGTYIRKRQIFFNHRTIIPPYRIPIISPCQIRIIITPTERGEVATRRSFIVHDPIYGPLATSGEIVAYCTGVTIKEIPAIKIVEWVKVEKVVLIVS